MWGGRDDEGQDWSPRSLFRLLFALSILVASVIVWPAGVKGGLGLAVPCN